MRLHFDTVATKLEREVKYVTEPTSMCAGVEQEVTRGHPSQDAFGADISVGYDFETHRLSFGPRIGTVIVTGEIGYSSYAYYSSELIGARGKV